MQDNKLCQVSRQLSCCGTAGVPCKRTMYLSLLGLSGGFLQVGIETNRMYNLYNISTAKLPLQNGQKSAYSEVLLLLSLLHSGILQSMISSYTIVRVLSQRLLCLIGLAEP